MDLANSLGSIEVGNKAELVLLDGNPLENIRNLLNAPAVIKVGKMYDAAARHKMA